MKSKPLPHSTEVSSFFDYIKEGFVMVCVFETIDDFIAIDPLNLGFDPKFIKELNLSKEETKKMVRDLVKFRKCLHTE
jgi:hypothetical protein